jgi:Na+-transporting methylmalonyl-CoA/oxaloacetate decarboxylase gamma subunit
MNWSALYQASTFLAIALLAIIVTIFVFASSLLGRAIESAAKEEKKKRREQVKKIAEKVREARKALNRAIKGTGEFKAARKSLGDLEKQKRNLERETKRISRSYEVFTRQGGVLHPGCSFLISAIFSDTAWAIGEGTWQWIGFTLWGLSLVAMGYGLYRIYFGLGSIESVAKTSEEAALKRTMEAFRLALKTHEDEKKPELKLKFQQKLPINLKKQSQEEIKFSIEVIRGDIARGVEIWFFAPEGFGFIGQDTWPQVAKFQIPNAITCKQTMTNLLAGISYNQSIQVKTPDKAATFTLGYELHCEGFMSKLQKIDVVVE